MKGITVTLGNVLVERDEAEGRSKGGIIIPDSAKKRTNRGIVRATAQFYYVGDQRLPAPATEGDTVAFSAYAGIDLEFEGKEYLLMKLTDIVAVFK